MERVHRAGYIHRDLKDENLLVTSRNGRRAVILADFGLAEHVGVGGRSVQPSGTRGWRAPQVVQRLEHGADADFYAFGILLFKLWIGKDIVDIVSDRISKVAMDQGLPEPSNAELSKALDDANLKGWDDQWWRVNQYKWYLPQAIEREYYGPSHY